MFLENPLVETIRNGIKDIGSRLLDLICPPVCPFCNTLKPDNEPVCPKCAVKLATPAGEYCRRCGGRRYKIFRETMDCERCRTTKFSFDRAIVLGEYEKEIRKLVLRMKTEKDGVLAAELMRLLVRYRKDELSAVAAELVVPVPMHRSRYWQRGVNSPDFLAEMLGQLLKIPVALRLVRRVRSTELQYTLSAHCRKENVKDAFAVNAVPRFGLSRFSPQVKGKRIVLIDDILTTGSTCNEVSKVLRQAGAASITVCAVARAEGYWTAHRNARQENSGITFAENG